MRAPTKESGDAATHFARGFVPLHCLCRPHGPRKETIMYQRLTVPAPEGYRADPSAALERLGRLEDRIEKLQTEY